MSETRCALCGVRFDPRGFQVHVAGVPGPYHSVGCALAAREKLGLDGLAQPARAHVEHLAASLTRARVEIEVERRRRAALEQELERLASRREALRRRERERAADARESDLEAALAVGGGVPSGPLAEKLRRRWFERR